MKKVQQKLKWLGVGSTAVVLLAATSLSAEDWEHSPSESWHSEEWYDPSDWFDDDAHDYESDTGLMGDSDYWDSNGLWSDDYDYDSTVNNSYDYGDGNSYTWDDITMSGLPPQTTAPTPIATILRATWLFTRLAPIRAVTSRNPI